MADPPNWLFVCNKPPSKFSSRFLDIVDNGDRGVIYWLAHVVTVACAV